ncbi:MAG: MFS transporter [Boseongicola sp.]|nr:MAG: MFS transporter [Boseongicola sp.]
MTEAPNDSRTRRNVMVLIAAQAVLGSQMPMIFIVGGLAGQSLAPNICLATLPISLIIVGSMLTASPLSAVMQRFGRKAGFFVGVTGGTLGAAIGAAGLLSAIIGPQLVKVTAEAMVVPFLGTYLAVIALNIIGSSVFLFLDTPRPRKNPEASGPGRSRWELLKTPEVAVAIIIAMVAYALMNLVMTSTPLAVVGCGYTTHNAADVVMGHVLAMFAPSFVTGHLIHRFGTERIIAIGLIILFGAGAVALAGTELMNFFIALILLGLGWNFTFIGATTMLSHTHTQEERGRVQGMNDMMVMGGVTVASLSSGGLMNCSGGDVVQGWNAVNLAMGPFLVLAGGALIWLLLRARNSDGLAS